MFVKKYVLALFFLLSGAWIACNLLNTSAMQKGTMPSWDLTKYHFAGPVITIEGIEKNLSGITFQPETGLLYAVANSPQRIYVIAKNGSLVRTIKLKQFHDTESITHLFGLVFVIAEEGLGTIVRVEITEATEEIVRQDWPCYQFGKSSMKNSGLEGVAWSGRYGLFGVQERPPRIMYSPFEGRGQGVDLSDLLSVRLKVRDFADLCLLPGRQESLLILSEASNSLHVVDMQGRECSRLSLYTGRFFLSTLMRQPEGVTVDETGRIYIVGEPNELLILERRPNGACVN